MVKKKPAAVEWQLAKDFGLAGNAVSGARAVRVMPGHMSLDVFVRIGLADSMSAAVRVAKGPGGRAARWRHPQGACLGQRGRGLRSSSLMDPAVWCGRCRWVTGALAVQRVEGDRPFGRLRPLGDEHEGVPERPRDGLEDVGSRPAPAREQRVDVGRHVAGRTPDLSDVVLIACSRSIGSPPVAFPPPPS